mgnify:CR=1 FL=1
MPKIGGYSLPPEIVAEMKRMLREAPEKALLDYARGDPELARGFRPGSRQSVGAIRLRLGHVLETDRDLDWELRYLLAMGDRLTEITGLLEVDALETMLPAFSAIYGRNRILAVLLVDYREDVAELAISVLEDHFDILRLDQKEARALICDHMYPLVQFAVDWFDVPSSPDAGDAAETAAADKDSTAASQLRAFQKLKDRILELEAKVHEQEQRIQNEKGLRRKIEEQHQTIQKLESELRETRRAVDTERRAAAGLKAEITELRRQKEALEESMRSRIAEGVAEELAQIRNHWLKRALEVEVEAERTARIDAATDILARVNDALRRQEETDRLSGRRSVLRARLAALEDGLRRVQTAQCEALHPLAELRTVERELTAEIERLRTLLGGPGDELSGVAIRLEARINAAATAPDLARFQAILEELGDVEVLSSVQLQRLYRCCHERFARLYAAAIPRVVKRQEDIADPVWQLERAVEQNEDLIVLLDGHNVIFTLVSLFGDVYENGAPGSLARQRLVELTVKVFQRAPNCRVEIFFDGPTATRRPHAPNIFEVYSGGEGEHRADRALIEQIEHCCRTRSAMPRILVTDDRDLRTRARELNTRVMPVPQFGAFLEEMLA